MSHQDLFHEPVLKKEILALLLFKNVKTVFDGTIGLGGHAEAILSDFPEIEKYIACDLDNEHLEFSRKRLGEWQGKLVFAHSNFSEIKKIVQESNISHPLVILLDLGLCSAQIDIAEKGFSFEKNGPLKMAFNGESSITCAQILNEFTEEEISRILWEYGEEKRARKLARCIVESRKEKFFETTKDLREVVDKNTHPRDLKKTLMRVFQALRIAVNDELNALTQTLESAVEIMQKGDRIGVISYHSLEDRIVKKFFLLHSRPLTEVTEKSLHTEIAPASYQLLTRKPVLPKNEEIAVNPRARSARLRILEKVL